MTTARVPEPDLPDGITPGELDAEARRDLRGLQKDTADVVAKHLVAAGMLVDEDPLRALEHARFARRRASRIAVVREAAGIAAYHAGEWNEALGELRAARRMGGGPGHLAVMADIERALGRPERALELVRAPEARELGRAETIELAIVAAGARRDLGELDAAVVGLQIAELEPARRDPWSARLFYAYADNLLAAGRESDALQWFVHTLDADEHGETDAAERIAELTGEPIDDGGVVFQGETDGPDDADQLDDGAEAQAAAPAADDTEPDTGHSTTADPSEGDAPLADGDRREEPAGVPAAADAGTAPADPEPTAVPGSDAAETDDAVAGSDAGAAVTGSPAGEPSDAVAPDVQPLDTAESVAAGDAPADEEAAADAPQVTAAGEGEPDR